MFKFSPILATFSTSASFTVMEASPFQASAMNSSIDPASESTACLATASTKFWNSSFFATKSVSEFTSTTAATLSSLRATLQRPSAAILPAFFSAFACPFFLRNSTAASISPSVWARAFLQSIMPAPVISLNSFTMPAVILAIFNLLNSSFSPAYIRAGAAIIPAPPLRLPLLLQYPGALSLPLRLLQPLPSVPQGFPHPDLPQSQHLPSWQQ